ncbi:hypothetical protein [Neobacillus sp. PS3-40]|uniref:hypothetical protein n=1 Tax=Neobacillus sp. PS3-40 TaxID=3070679 RepID=UPI0027DF4DF3|nr:hypothetical protein [Neobacillus sp. PS3-40]WML44393.1 hypothetical protein RCG20_00295 [Neobacillus sp. PS3-40]
MFIVVNKDGSREKAILNCSQTDAQLEDLKAQIMDKNVNQEKRYLVSYENGV